MQKGLVLREMQMLPSLLRPIMDRLIRTGTGGTVQPLRLKGQIKVNGPLLGLKADIRHLPRRLETQGGCEQQRGIHQNVTSIAMMKVHQAKLFFTGRAPIKAIDLPLIGSP
jgi:hypothetical protein